MAPPRILPSESILRRWIEEEGLTHQQCADRVFAQTGVKVSRASVSASLSKAGYTKRVRYPELIPWRVRVDHNRHHFLNMLRLEGRSQAGVRLSEHDRRQLESFKRRLEESNAVVAYIRDTDEGWFLVHRRPGVDLGMIREPDRKPASDRKSSKGRR